MRRTCSDNIQNQDESDIDCGGLCGPTCVAGENCNGNGDCFSDDCQGGICQAGVGTCDDGIVNQNESDVDCGGICGATCVVGESCNVNGDCVDRVCSAGVCAFTDLQVVKTAWTPTDPFDDAIRLRFQLVNNDSVPVPYDELTVRYWYTIDTGAQPQTATCDYAAEQGCANITTQFTQVTPVPGADYYLELGYLSGAGDLLSGPSDAMMFQIRKPSLQNYDETDDHSWAGGEPATPTIWPEITVYRNGVLVWGYEPGTCADGMLNQDESDVDCGGICGSTCLVGEMCNTYADCANSNCIGGYCTDMGLKVQLDKNPPIKPLDPWLEGVVRVVNTGSSPIPWGEITVRYWFTYEGTPQGFYTNCLQADLLCPNIYTSYVPLAPARPGADYYVEYSFNPASGDLSASAFSDFEINHRKLDSSVWDETNDYSYGEPLSYTDWPQITAYLNGELVWGTEP